MLTQEQVDALIDKHNLDWLDDDALHEAYRLGMDHAIEGDLFACTVLDSLTGAPLYRSDVFTVRDGEGIFLNRVLSLNAATD